VAVPVLRSVASATDGNADNTLDIAKPAGLAVGDLLLYWMATGGNGTTISQYPTTNWTGRSVIPAGTTVAGALSCQLATKIADASDVALATFTFTQSTLQVKSGILVAVSGASQLNPVNQYGFASINNSTQYPTPSLTPNAPEGLYLGFAGSKAGTALASSTALTIPTGANPNRANSSSAMGWVAGPAQGVASGTKLITFSVADGGAVAAVIIVPPSTDFTAPAVPTGLTIEMTTG
jgi:hypothetical protein